MEIENKMQKLIQFVFDMQKYSYQCLNVKSFIFQSGVAKKPYNPILGEYFVCSMDTTTPTTSPAHPSQQLLQPNDSNEDDDEGAETGPDGRVYFVAEQVSHHPPGKSVQM